MAAAALSFPDVSCLVGLCQVFVAIFSDRKTIALFKHFQPFLSFISFSVNSNYCSYFKWNSSRSVPNWHTGVKHGLFTRKLAPENERKEDTEETRTDNNP